MASVSRRTCSFLVLLLIALMQAASALATVNVTASLDRASFSEEDEAHITVSVSGSMSATEPVSPQVTGLDIVLTGRSTQIQIVNGGVNTVAEYTYTVVADDEGSFAIPPFSVFASGVEYKSNSLNLKVSHGGASPPPTAGPNPFAPSPFGASPFTQPPITQPQPTPRGDNQPFWIVTRVTKANPYVGEQILFQFKLYAKVSADIVDLEMPEFRDFLAEEVVSENKGSEMVGGERYSTYEVVYALFPLKSGTARIDETRLKLRYFVNRRGGGGSLFDRFFNDPFFNSGSEPQNKLLKAPPLEVTVQNLPEPMPADFTRLIGNFSARASLSDTSVEAGDSLTLTVSLTGKGNIRDAVLPEIKFTKAKVYQDKPVVDTQKTASGINGAKTFKMAIVPEEPGDYALPGMTLSYFDTGKGAYEALGLPEMRFAVTPSSRQERTNTVIAGNNGAEPSASGIALTDLAPLVGDGFMALSPAVRVGTPGWAKAGILFSPLLFVGALLKRLFRGRASLFSRRSARRLALNGAIRVLSAAKASDEEALTAVRAYFSTVASVTGSALTAADMVELCRTRGLPDKTGAELAVVLERLEAAQYAFSGAGDLSEARRKLAALLRAADVVLGK